MDCNVLGELVEVAFGGVVVFVAGLATGKAAGLLVAGTAAATGFADTFAGAFFW